MSKNNDIVLYILMRTDLASLNSGKMAAQACHAANQCVYQLSEFPKSKCFQNLKNWQKSTPDGFGTTIVLDGGDMSAIERIINEVQSDIDVFSGITHDPSYPILDGSFTHLIPLNICGFVLGNRNNETIKKYLSELKLHK